MQVRKSFVLGLILIIAFAASSTLDQACFPQTVRAGAPQKPMVVADFEDGNLTSKSGAKWYTITDQPMGGKSTVDGAVVAGGAGGTKKAGRMAGTVTTDFKFGGFAGIGVELAKPPGQDMSGYTGISFYAKGDGGQYRISVPTAAVKDHNEYGKEFVAPKAWTVIKIPFSQLAQNPNWGRKVAWTGKDITGVEFVTVGAPRATYVLQIDQVGFY